MEILSVFDQAFSLYGQVVTGLETTTKSLFTALCSTPLPDGTDYVPEDPLLQSLPAAKVIADHCYGGMPVQLGWCNGHNTKLNCLEYHRDSEFNLGTEDFILLLAKQEDITNGYLDTGTVKAFRVPAGILVEVFATTLHYAPCHTDESKGFRVMVALPKGTNTDKPNMEPATPEDLLLWAKNKWLLAHEEASEAASGAAVRLTGENIDIAKDLR